jgi:hypothetical protein
VKRAVLLAVVAAAACSRAPGRPFAVGFLLPVSPRVAASAGSLGLELAAQASPGAASVSAAVPLKNRRGEVTADWYRLRFLTDRAVAEGASGIFFRLPRTPAGRDYLEYVEESQSVDRMLRELVAVLPILRRGAPAAAPFAVPAGLDLRAWTYAGRPYVLLVNPSGAPRPLEARTLEPWRALFAVRADPRESLVPCGARQCLPAGGVLWLEGRL